MRYFTDPASIKEVSTHEENDKGHGRIEQRTAHVTEQIDWLQEVHNWPGLRSIGMVRSRVSRKEKETEEVRLYISSLTVKWYHFLLRW